MPTTTTKTISKPLCAAALALSLMLAACGSRPAPTVVQPTAPADTSAPAAATDSVAEAPSVAEQPTQDGGLNQASQLPNPDDYTWVQVASGFDSPIFVTESADQSGRLFVVEQPGQIWALSGGQASLFLDIRERVGSRANEQGLLGMAFHPNYVDNGYLYVNYTDRNGDTVIARFSSNADQADPGSETVLLRVDQPYDNHNGGHIEFGLDGYLYIGLGDGGSGGDPLGAGQALDTLLGKLLRIDVDNGEPYAIPAGNASGGLPEIWAYGLRNPWRFSFDVATGDLYIGDVGQGEWEEIDYLPGNAEAGANFGWNYYEGTHGYQGNPPAGVNFVFPVAEYDHASGCSVTGGYVYRGHELDAWRGVYVYGDFCSGEIYGLLRGADGNWQTARLYDTDFLISSFGRDKHGGIYLVDRAGSIYQLQQK